MRPTRPDARNQSNLAVRLMTSLHGKLKTENFPGWRGDCRLGVEVAVTTFGSRDFRQKMLTVMKKVRYHCNHLRHVHTSRNMRQVRHLARLKKDMEVQSLRMLLSTPRRDWRPAVVAAAAVVTLDKRLSNFHQMHTSNRVTQMKKLLATKLIPTSRCSRCYSPEEAATKSFRRHQNDARFRSMRRRRVPLLHRRTFAAWRPRDVDRLITSMRRSFSTPCAGTRGVVDGRIPPRTCTRTRGRWSNSVPCPADRGPWAT